MVLKMSGKSKYVSSALETAWKRHWYHVLGLCAFIGFLSFKPSEPYLSQYLICNLSTKQEYCAGFSSSSLCNVNEPCLWSDSFCNVNSCINIASNQCGESDYNYCELHNSNCEYVTCYKHFSDSQVNDEIYPWSTYAYFPFLLLLGPYAELISYPIAILAGIFGRVVTRLLLIFGSTLTEMQIGQVTYAIGTAAEDVFSAYIYYSLPSELYTKSTSYVKASFFASSMISGVIGDILVVQYNYSLEVLMVISAVSVTIGATIGLFVIRSNPTQTQSHKSLREKILLFNRQVKYLLHSMKDSETLCLTIYWLFGNAVFTTVYNYEVSIYDELNGNNNWNGSALSAMLLGGVIGALIPSFLHTGDLSTYETSLYLIIAELVCVISLSLSIYLWSTIPTVTLLAIFFSSWQYINVVTFAKIAYNILHVQRQDTRLYEAVNDIDISTRLSDDVDLTSNVFTLSDDVSDTRNKPSPPFSIAIVVVTVTCVAIQVILQSVLLTTLRYDLKTAFAIMCYLFAAVSFFHIAWCLRSLYIKVNR